MTLVVFEVEANSKISAFWLTVNETDVVDVGTSGSIDLPPGQHLLTWAMFGTPGGKIAITAKVGEKQLFKVKNSRLTGSNEQGGGHRFFEVE